MNYKERLVILNPNLDLENGISKINELMEDGWRVSDDNMVYSVKATTSYGECDLSVIKMIK